jgi:hypothetical protein
MNLTSFIGKGTDRDFRHIVNISFEMTIGLLRFGYPDFG